MIRFLLLSFVLVHCSLAQHHKPPAIPPKKWPTLSGKQPRIIARGGYTGIFPESSDLAIGLALDLTDALDMRATFLCNLQLTKDGVGFCQTDIRLNNSTNIAQIFPDGEKTYNVNGNQVQGWFAVDYNADVILSNVSATQSMLARPTSFDGQPILTVEDIALPKQGEEGGPPPPAPPVFWLSVPYAAFYKEHDLSVPDYLQAVMKDVGMSFISSPEIGFLKEIGGKVNKIKTKLVFEFLDKNAVEPTTNQTYGSILENLAAIKGYAAGIMVPKGYIWPENANRYLESPTTLVADAHKAGLEIYASGFANDMPASYNYSYDPTAEYQIFMDSPFSVDGVVTDFPTTAAETIACFSLSNNTKRNLEKSLIISHNGASGMFPGCTDLAYEQAVKDGADVIDCSVQMSKDGVAFCLDTADLMGDTNAVTSFMARSSSVPEIQSDKGIFTFDLTWSEIQTLKPQMLSPFAKETGYQRNPAANNQGKFMTLSQFLDFAKQKAVSGILINIENVAYLASKKGLDVMESVSSALKNATLDQNSNKTVLIQSDDSSVLSKFQGVPSYKTVLTIKENIGGAPRQPVDEIKKYASAVVLSRTSLITTNAGFALETTPVLKEMKDANISVYVSVLRNEFVTLAYDYFSDPMLEIATYFAGLGVDGVMTEYPGTASKYLKSPCTDMNGAYAILPIEPGALLNVAAPEALPPAIAPAPELDMADVVDPPLPAVTKVTTNNSPPGPPGPPGSAGAGAPAPASSSIANVANTGSILAAIIGIGFLFA